MNNSFKKIIFTLDERVRGIRGSQLTCKDLDSFSFKKLDSFFLRNNNYFSNVGKPIPFHFELNWHLKKGALITDFLLSGHLGETYGVCLNEKAFKIFKEFSIIPNEVYPVNLFDENGKELATKYYWLYPLRLVECINFKKSIQPYSPPTKIKNEADFIEIRSKIPQYLQGLNEKYPFNNPEKYNLQQRVKRWGTPEKFYLTEDVFSQYDFLGFKYDIDFFVSEKLENAIKEAGLTGIDFWEVKEQRFVYEKKGWFS